jgi:hypothetical protein
MMRQVLVSTAIAGLLVLMEPGLVAAQTSTAPAAQPQKTTAAKPMKKATHKPMAKKASMGGHHSMDNIADKLNACQAKAMSDRQSCMDAATKM